MMSPAPKQNGLPPHSPRVLRSHVSRDDREALISCISYALSSIAMSLVNKAVFSRHNFDFPSSVLMMQGGVTAVLLTLASAIRVLPPLPVELALLRRMAPVAPAPRTRAALAGHAARGARHHPPTAQVTVLFAAMLWTSSRALRFCSVPIVTVFKNVSVVLITLWERVAYGERIGVGVGLSLAFMMSGSAIAAFGDHARDPVGYGWLVLNVFATVAHVAMIRARLPRFASPASKTLHNQLLAFFLFASAAGCQGELRDFPVALWVQPREMKVALAASCVLGLLINLATFWCMRATSGSTYSFVGSSNKIPVALLGHFFFSSGLSTVGWVGVIFGLISGLCYTLSKSLFVEQPAPGRPAFGDDDDDDDDDDAGTKSLLRAERDAEEAAAADPGGGGGSQIIQMAELGRSHAR